MNKASEELERGEMKKLLANFCIPSLAASLITAFYSITDQIFIGNALGTAGNAATGVVFPAVTLITAASLMCGVGGSAVMNLSLGRGETERARRAVGASFALMTLCGTILALPVLFATRSVLLIFGCTEDLLPLASLYGRITSLTFIPAIIGAAGTFFVRADGSPKYALLCTTVGAGLNIALDALFICFFGWGIAGTAWATAASQCVSAAMVIKYLVNFRTVNLQATDFVPNLRITVRIAALGTGPMCNLLTQALVQVFLNSALRKYGADSQQGSEILLAAASVAGKASMIASAIATGLTNGMQPVISYNYGHGNYRRVIEAGRMVIGAVIASSFGVFLLFQLAPYQLTSLFGAGSPAYFTFAEKLFRIFYMLIFLNGLQNSVGGFFSAQGKPMHSIMISITRQVIFLPALLVLLPIRFGITGILWSGPIADAAMATLALCLLKKQFGRLRELENGVANGMSLNILK